MKTHFVKTENAARLAQGMQMLTERGAREAAWMLVTGRPGEGKTTTLYNWCALHGAAFVTAQQGMTPSRLIAALAEKLGMPMTRNVQEALGARLAQEQITIVVDEAQFCLPENAACLERLRGITDKSGTPVILVAMEKDVWKFGQREQISSRIFNWVEFKPASLEDVAKACAQLSDIEIAADLVQRIHRETKGRFRTVLNAISRCEMAAKGAELRTLTAHDMRRMPLCEDYRQGHDLVARRATGTPRKDEA